MKHIFYCEMKSKAEAEELNAIIEKANADIAEYCAVKKVFSKKYVQKRGKAAQKSSNSQRFSKTFKNFQMLLI